MKKLKHIEVNCPVFKTSIDYVVNCDYQELFKYCQKKFHVEDEDFEGLSEAAGAALLFRGEDCLYRVIWLEKFSINHLKLGVLVHETTHAVIRLLEHKGIPFSSQDNQDETMAYLMDYFISNFIHDYKKKK